MAPRWRRDGAEMAPRWRRGTSSTRHTPLSPSQPMLFGIIFGLAGINLLFLPWFWIRLARRADDPVGEKRRKMFLEKTQAIQRATSFKMEKAREPRARHARDTREIRARCDHEMRPRDVLARWRCSSSPPVTGGRHEERAQGVERTDE